MKKIIAVAATLFAAVALASAESPEITIGARGTFAFGLGTTMADDFKDLFAEEMEDVPGLDVDVKTDLGKTLSFGGALFAKIAIWNGLGIQPELGFTHSTIGTKISIDFNFMGISESEEIKGSISYNTLDIPLLITYDIAVNDSFSVTPFLGPQFSIPLGKAKVNDFDFGDEDEDEDDDSEELDEFDIETSVLVSLVFGVNAAYKVGPGAIFADLRYNLGLNALELSDSDYSLKFATPRSLALSLGYQLKL